MKLGTIVRQLTARKVTMSNTVTTRYDNKALVTFFTLVIILSLAAEAYIVKGGPLWMYFVLMWIPAFSAIIASAVSLKDDKEKFSLKRFLSALGIRENCEGGNSHEDEYRKIRYWKPQIDENADRCGNAVLRRRSVPDHS